MVMAVIVIKLLGGGGVVEVETLNRAVNAEALISLCVYVL